MKLKKKYRAGGKTKKPMVYAQETTKVPSQTTSGTANYFDVYNVGNTTGFDRYADLYNKISGSNDMTTDSLQEMYNNPSQLYSSYVDTYSRKDRDGNIIGKTNVPNQGYMNPKSNAYTKRDEKGNVVNMPGFTYSFSEDERDPSNPLFTQSKGGDDFRARVSQNQITFDDQGNFQYMLKSDGKSPSYELSDDEKKSIELYVKNKTLSQYSTQGESDLSKYGDPTPQVTPITTDKIKNISPTGGGVNLRPTFVDQGDQVGDDMAGGGMDNYRFDDSDPLGMDDDKIVPSSTGGDTGDDTGSDGGKDGGGKETKEKETTTKETTTGVSVGGKDYDNEEEAKAALKKIPQTQLNDEEYEYLFGKSGMKIPGYKKGGITLKKKKK